MTIFGIHVSFRGCISLEVLATLGKSGGFLLDDDKYQEQQELMLRFFGRNGFLSTCSKLNVYPNLFPAF